MDGALDKKAAMRLKCEEQVDNGLKLRVREKCN